MRRVVWTGILVVAALGFEAAIFKLAGTGTCASGGPYVIADECPSGPGWWVALLLVSALAIAAATLFVPIGSEERGWLPALAFVPGTRESAVAGPVTGLVILAAGTDTWNLVIAGVLALGAPLLWLGARWLLADTDRVLRERRRREAREREANRT